MRALPESSWLKFGPAGRGTYDWMTGAPPPSEEKQLQGYHWDALSPDEGTKSEVIIYIILPTASLIFISLLAFLVYRKCSRSKLDRRAVAVNLQDAKGNTDFQSSLTWDTEQLPRSSLDTLDSVLLWVYLPPPYEKTITKITRTASSSSPKDMESVKIEDPETKLCLEETKASGRSM